MVNSDSVNCTRQIMDSDGPTVADGFYEELFHGPDGKRTLEPDTKKSA